MKKHFVRHENDRRFRAALLQREQRGARENNLIVVHGRAGEGKTRTLYNWASTPNEFNEQGVMLTGDPDWTVPRMMRLLANRLGIVTQGDWQGAVAEHIADHEVSLVIDEAGFALANRAACLEKLRLITDKAGTPLVLVIMERDMVRLRQYDQITRRATLCPFAPSTLGDVRTACAQLAEVEIAEDLIARIHAESGGRISQVLECINTVERAAIAAGRQTVTATDVASYALFTSFDAPTVPGRRVR